MAEAALIDDDESEQVVDIRRTLGEEAIMIRIPLGKGDCGPDAQCMALTAMLISQTGQGKDREHQGRSKMAAEMVA